MSWLMGRRPDRYPRLTWLVWQLVEMVLLLALLWILVPSSWSRGAEVALVIAVLVGAWVVNYLWLPFGPARTTNVAG